MPKHATRTSFKSGADHPNWKGGIANFENLAPHTQENYSRAEARKLMGYPDGIVHHKDGDLRNMDKCNLVVLSSQGEHVAIHNRLRKGQHNKNSMQVAFKDKVLGMRSSSREVAKLLGISNNTVLRIRRRYGTD